MVYMGSKTRYVKDIAPIINKYIKDNNITVVYDVFCGGANLADKLECENVYCSDLSPTLIALHKQVQKDAAAIPTEVTREDWDKCYAEYKCLLKDFNYKTKIPLYIIGALEWYASYSRKGFSGGFAKNVVNRNFYDEARRNHAAQAETPNYQKLHFDCKDYRDVEIPANVLLYIDPPYKSTKPYQISPKFNHEEFYEWLREKSKTNPIFISEQEMPDDFKPIWIKETNRTVGQDNYYKATEKLYFIDNREVKE